MNKEELVKSYLYRHYGASKYIPEKVQMPSCECMLNGKPDNGLWASPLIRKAYCWKDFCMDKKFEVESLKQHFDFKLSAEARVLVLDRNIAPVYIDRKQWATNLLNMERIVAECWDAIYYDKGELGRTMEYWDVTSIVIFNPDIVIPVKTWKGLFAKWTSGLLRRI